MKTTSAILTSLQLSAIVIFVGLASPTMLYGSFVNGIETISQSYHISAQRSETITQYPLDSPRVITTYTGGYDLSTSDGSPLSASTAGTAGYNLNAGADINRFSLYNHASVPKHNWDMPPISYRGRVDTYAQGIWDFRPEGNSLDLHLVIWAQYSEYTPLGWYGGLTATLMDMTTSSTLLNIVNPVNTQPGIWLGYHGANDYAFAVDPSYVYEFSLSGYSHTFDADGSSLSMSASITAVPEPSTLIGGALLAIPLGLQGIKILRNRKRTA